MSLATAKYDVSINGKGYILLEESYRKKAQQPFNARFSTGDPGYGDLSYFQFLAQQGFNGEGQSIFSTLSKYKQSAGWETRSGKAYLARGTESLTLAASLPSQVALTAAGTAVLYDDFQESVAPTAAKWPTGYVYESPETFGVLHPNNTTLNSKKRARSGVILYTDPPTVPVWIGARGTLGSNPMNGQWTNLPVYRTSSDLNATGAWEFELYTESVGVNTTHCRFVFLHSAAGGYVLEISGADMVTAKLYKTSATTISEALRNNTGDTLLKTFTALTAKSLADTVIKLTRDSSGNFELFQDTVSKGTHNDTTYSAAGSVGWATAVHVSAYNSGAGVITTDLATWITNVKLPSAVQADMGEGSKFVTYNNQLWICWYTNDAAWTQTNLHAGSLASNIPPIYHVNARDIAVWSRDGQPTAGKNVFLAMCRGQVFRVYNGNSNVYSVATTLYGSCVIPINSTTILIWGTTAENSGIPGFEILKFSAESWTLSTQTVTTLDGGTAGRALSTAAIDSSGIIYLGISDLSQQASVPSRLFQISATDVLATKPTVTAMYNLSDFVLRGMVSFQGSIYLYGARIRGTKSYALILKFPSTVVWESTLGKELNNAGPAVAYNHGLMTAWKNLDNVLFLGMNDLALWDPVLQMDLSGNIQEAASFNSKQFTYGGGNILAIAEWNGRVYLLNSLAGTIRRTLTARGSLGSDFSYATLELSSMGGNTPLINKSLISVTVQISAAIPTGETLSVLINDTVVGTMTSTDGTRKEILLSSELTASAFVVKLRLPQNSTWTGYINATMGPVLRYIPTQYKKRAWAMAIRATKALKLADGTRETRATTTMFSDLEAAWASNVPLTFIDVDGVSYSVVVTDFDQRRPLLDRRGGQNAEAFYFLELLEA